MHTNTRTDHAYDIIINIATTLPAAVFLCKNIINKTN